MCFRIPNASVKPLLWILTVTLTAGLAMAQEAKPQQTKPKPSPKGPAAEAFVNKAEKRLYDLSLELSRASWIQATYITHDTE